LCTVTHAAWYFNRFLQAATCSGGVEPHVVPAEGARITNICSPILIGPTFWLKELVARAPGRCPRCGGQCAPQHGRHPAGCTLKESGYSTWWYVWGCPLDHGDGLGWGP
jgi:hypothetical protein